MAPDDEATVTVSYNIREIDLPVNEVLEGSVSLSLDSGDGSPATLYEYDDYFVDHKNAQVTLYKDLDGTITVSYLPVIVSGLNKDDETLPARLDTQRWTTTGDSTTKTFKLPFVPIDPVSRIQIDNQDCVEGEDFTVDYANGEITFFTPPSAGSTIEVIYTPNVRDQSLRAGIRCKRTSSSSKAYVYTVSFTHRP